MPRGEMTLMKGMVSREWGLVAGGRSVFTRSCSLNVVADVDHSASCPSRGASRRSSTRPESRPLPRAARATPSCGAARTWESPASFGEPHFLPFDSLHRLLTSSIRSREPSFIRSYKAAHCVEAWVEHASTKKKCCRPEDLAFKRLLTTVLFSGKGAGARRATSSSTRWLRCAPWPE